MKNKVKNKIVYIIFSFLFMLFTFPCNIFGAGSFSVEAGNTSLNVGGSTTITISTSGCAGVFSISSSNPGVVSVSSSSEFIDGSINITASAGSVGSATITVTAVDVADTNIEAISGSRSVTINVVEPVQKPQTNNNNNNYVAPKKNTNTYLSYLEISEEGMTPSFIKTKENYAVTVGMNVNEINVSAGTESDTSYYYVEGNKNLVEGDNTIRVVVVSESGNTRTYYITVTKTNNPEESNAYLENLVIEDIKLTPDFQSEIFEYDLGKVGIEVEKLNILTFTKNENATVEIIGNESLKSGENEIKIIVTAQDKITKKEYILKVTKEEEKILETNELKQVKERSSTEKFNDFIENIWLSVKANALLVLMYIFIVVEFIQIVYLYKQLNKKDELLEKYGIEDDENEPHVETMTRTRRGHNANTESKSLSKIDIPLEIDDFNKKDDKILKFDELKKDSDDDIFDD